MSLSAAAARHHCPSLRPKVLVILPPTHTRPDLDRVVGLARQAFHDEAIDLPDLDLRFEWVSEDDRLPSGPGRDSKSDPHAGRRGSTLANTNGEHHRGQTSATPGVSATNERLRPAEHEHGLQRWAYSQPVPRSPDPAACLGHLPSPQRSPTLPISRPSCTHALLSRISHGVPRPATRHAHRVYVSNLQPTLSSSDLLALLPPAACPANICLSPAGPYGPNNQLVRSVAFTFDLPSDAASLVKWIKDQAGLAPWTVPGLSARVSRAPPPLLALAARAAARAEGLPSALPAADPLHQITREDCPVAKSEAQPNAAATGLPPQEVEHEPRELECPVASKAQPAAQGGHMYVGIPNVCPMAPVRQVFGLLLDPVKPLGLVPVHVGQTGVRQIGDTEVLGRGIRLMFDDEVDAERFAAYVEEGNDTGQFEAIVAQGKARLEVSVQPVLSEE